MRTSTLSRALEAERLRRTGLSAADACKQVGVALSNYYAWRSKRKAEFGAPNIAPSPESGTKIIIHDPMRKKPGPKPGKKPPIAQASSHVIIIRTTVEALPEVLRGL